MAEKFNKDAVYKAAKPEEKDYFINDGGGLYLWVKSGGSKLWQLVYIPMRANGSASPWGHHIQA